MSLINLSPSREPRALCYVWQWLLAWGCLLDGVIGVLTLGRLNGTLALRAAKRLTQARRDPRNPTNKP